MVSAVSVGRPQSVERGAGSGRHWSEAITVVPRPAVPAAADSRQDALPDKRNGGWRRMANMHHRRILGFSAADACIQSGMKILRLGNGDGRHVFRGVPMNIQRCRRPTAARSGPAARDARARGPRLKFMCCIIHRMLIKLCLQRYPKVRLATSHSWPRPHYLGILKANCEINT